MSDDPPIRVRPIEVIVAVISVLVVLYLLLPSPGTPREGSRRMQCGYNLKQLALALQNYHDTFGRFPAGAEVRQSAATGDQPTWGQSWIVATLPFCEQAPLHDGLRKAEAQGAEYVSPQLRQVADKVKLRYLLCPSSKLPESEKLNGFQLFIPSYVGIMGANELTTGPAAQQVTEMKGPIVPGPYAGWAASNGMLPINQRLKFADCTDGTANTLIVAEVSAWYYDDRGRRQNPALAFSGNSPATAGWLAGTNLTGTLGNDFMAVPADRVNNLVTVEHAINTNNKRGKSDAHPNWTTGGIGPRGLNNPLTSEHPAGAMAGFVDGHVQLLTKETDPSVLKRLAIRDDGDLLLDY
ncbi:DUF1559 domain-containing protein [Anatilimnocola sp. NA78]|uniref:DUF1559 domain-containing protein n=1 Tax=Anatilimnocola sp. NA78 TaxID=3415683 RepID=UPI003CE53819